MDGQLPLGLSGVQAGLQFSNGLIPGGKIGGLLLQGFLYGQLPLGLLGEKLGLQFFDLPLQLGLGLLLRAGGLSAYQG